MASNMSRASIGAKGAGSARHRLLPEGRLAGPMPWVIAIMMFLTVLAAATGMALDQGARNLGNDLRGRVTVQILEGDAEVRALTVARLAEALRARPDVRAVRVVEESALLENLRPWLGDDVASSDLPIPALVDADMRLPTDAGKQAAGLADLRRMVQGISATARVEPHAGFLAPLAALIRTLTWLALGLVLLMAIATGATVILAARGAHNSHSGTIEVLHLMGATDVQIARLFQRRIALDALFGGALGFVTAVIALLLIGRQVNAIGSDVLGSVTLPLYAWPVLVALPLAGALLALITARFTVLRALRRSL